MLITNHVLAGALIGRATRAPASAFALGIVSHLVMDVTPHWGDADMTVFLRVARVDGLLGLATIAAMVATTSPTQRRSVLAGITGACLPDLDKPARHLVGRRAFPVSVERWLADIQHESPRRMPVEFTAGAVLALAWFCPRRYGGVVDRCEGERWTWRRLPATVASSQVLVAAS